MSYNGYGDYQTWGIYQRLASEEGSFWTEQAAIFWESAEGDDTFSRSERARFALAHALEEDRRIVGDIYGPAFSNVVMRSSSRANPDPFQYPTGSGRRLSRISPGSVDSLPSPSYPPGTDSCSFRFLVVVSLPMEYWLMAISRTTGPSFLGTASTRGLLPMAGVLPPQGGISGRVLVQHIKMKPASAARQP